MNFKSFNDLALDIKSNLYRLHGSDYDLVVGIPRSGMIPAYMIGLYLNINVADFDALIDNKKISKGITRSTKAALNSTWDAKNILLVDDSILSGQSFAKKMGVLSLDLKGKITTLAIYSNLLFRSDVDIFFEYVPMPRVFEWNIFHRDLMGVACLDIDGVLCHDPSEEQNDDGDRYIDFLLNAKPLFIPTYKIHSLVTSRLEKYRGQTENWLKKQGIEYENLVMINLPTKEDRQRLGVHALHKANYYIQSKLDFFIESDISQALKIMEVSGKPVYCTDKNQMLKPGLNTIILKSQISMLEKLKVMLIKYLPKSIKKVIKPMYIISSRR